MAQEAWRAYLELALGATEATRKKATKTVRRLAGKSAVSAEQLQSMVEDLLRTSATNRDALTKLVRYELERALGAVGLATAEEVAALTARVRDLETKQRAASTPVPPSGPAKVAKKAVKKAMPGPIYDDGEPLAGGGDVELGASEPAAPPVVKKAVARKRVANTTMPAEPAAVADAAPDSAEAAPTKAAAKAQTKAPTKAPSRAAKAAPAKAAPTKRTTTTRRPPAKKATS